MQGGFSIETNWHYDIHGEIMKSMYMFYQLI